MNPFNIMKKDHKNVSKILGQIYKTTEKSAATRQKLFAKVKKELDLHTSMEETIFYPALKEYKKIRTMAFEAFEEHAIVDHLLNELKNEKSGTEMWTAKFKVLKELVEHHVEEEENELFVKVKKILPADQLQEIGNKMQQFKQENT